MNATFADRLSANIIEADSRLCVGCDPEPELFPPDLGAVNVLTALEAFGYGLIAATAEYAAAFKFQSAFYERFGGAGICILEKHLHAARETGRAVILDVKRGDVGHTTRAYAEAYLAAGAPLEADAITVAPYLGRDTLDTFAEVAAAHGKGFFVLVKTSNPSAADLQDLPAGDGEKVYQRLARLVAEVGAQLVGAGGWSSVGAVVGATYPDVIADLRALMPRQYFLLPGVGAQGGDVAQLRAAFDDAGLGALVAASRGVAAAWRERPGTPWPEAAAAAARDLRDQINGVVAR